MGKCSETVNPIYSPSAGRAWFAKFATIDRIPGVAARFPPSHMALAKQTVRSDGVTQVLRVFDTLEIYVKEVFPSSARLEVVLELMGSVLPDDGDSDE